MLTSLFELLDQLKAGIAKPCDLITVGPWENDSLSFRFIWCDTSPESENIRMQLIVERDEIIRLNGDERIILESIVARVNSKLEDYYGIEKGELNENSK